MAMWQLHGGSSVCGEMLFVHPSVCGGASQVFAGQVSANHCHCHGPGAWKNNMSCGVCLCAFLWAACGSLQLTMTASFRCWLVGNGACIVIGTNVVCCHAGKAREIGTRVEQDNGDDAMLKIQHAQSIIGCGWHETVPTGPVTHGTRARQPTPASPTPAATNLLPKACGPTTSWLAFCTAGLWSAIHSQVCKMPSHNQPVQSKCCSSGGKMPC